MNDPLTSKILWPLKTKLCSAIQTEKIIENKKNHKRAGSSYEMLSVLRSALVIDRTLGSVTYEQCTLLIILKITGIGQKLVHMKLSTAYMRAYNNNSILGEILNSIYSSVLTWLTLECH